MSEYFCSERSPIPTRIRLIRGGLVDLKEVHKMLTRFFSAHLLQGGPVFSSIMHFICIVRSSAICDVPACSGKTLNGKGNLPCVYGSSHMREFCARSLEHVATPKQMPHPLATLTAHRGPPPDFEGDAIAAAHWHVYRRCCYRYLATSRQHRGRSLHLPPPRCAWLGPFFWRATRKSSQAQDTYESRMDGMRGSNYNVPYGL